MGFVENLVLFTAVKELQIDLEFTKLRPWLGWNTFLTHSVGYGTNYPRTKLILTPWLVLSHL